MDNTRQFSFRRFANILRIDLAEQRKGLIIAVSIILGIHFIIYLSSAFSGPSEEIHTIFFANALMVAGLIATSLIFRDFYRKEESYFSLMLPASPLEKYLSRFLITTVGYILGGIVIYFIYSSIAMGISQAIFGHHMGVFNPFSVTLWQLIGGYIFAHSIFFFGAVYFKKAAYLKTLLSIIVLLLVLTLFATLITALSTITWIGEFFPFTILNLDVIQLPNTGELLRFFTVIGTIAKYFFCFIFIPALWVIGYLRFREIEVR